MDSLESSSVGQRSLCCPDPARLARKGILNFLNPNTSRPSRWLACDPPNKWSPRRPCCLPRLLQTDQLSVRLPSCAMQLVSWTTVPGQCTACTFLDFGSEDNSMFHLHWKSDTVRSQYRTSRSGTRLSNLQRGAIHTPHSHTDYR